MKIHRNEKIQTDSRKDGSSFCRPVSKLTETPVTSLECILQRSDGQIEHVMYYRPMLQSYCLLSDFGKCRIMVTGVG